MVFIFLTISCISDVERDKQNECRVESEDIRDRKVAGGAKKRQQRTRQQCGEVEKVN